MSSQRQPPDRPDGIDDLDFDTPVSDDERRLAERLAAALEPSSRLASSTLPPSSLPPTEAPSQPPVEHLLETAQLLRMSQHADLSAEASGKMKAELLQAFEHTRKQSATDPGTEERDTLRSRSGAPSGRWLRFLPIPIVAFAGLLFVLRVGLGPESEVESSSVAERVDTEPMPAPESIAPFPQESRELLRTQARAITVGRNDPKRVELERELRAYRRQVLAVLELRRERSR